jgi:hypothetical protein
MRGLSAAVLIGSVPVRFLRRVKRGCVPFDVHWHLNTMISPQRALIEILLELSMEGNTTVT